MKEWQYNFIIMYAVTHVGPCVLFVGESVNISLYRGLYIIDINIICIVTFVIQLIAVWCVLIGIGLEGL